MNPASVEWVRYGVSWPSGRRKGWPNHKDPVVVPSAKQKPRSFGLNNIIKILAAYATIVGSSLALCQTPADQQTPPVQLKVQETPMPPPIAIAAPPTVIGEVSHPLTAKEAAQIALKYQQSLVTSAADVLSASGRAQEARSSLYPNLGISGSYSRSENFRIPDSGVGLAGGPGYNSSATLRQLIFDFNKTRDVVSQASAQEDAAKHSYTSDQSNLVFQVKQAFYSFVQNIHLVTVGEANLSSRNAQLALARARYNVGIGQPADLVQAETNLSDSQQSLVQARANAASSQMALALLMGIDPRTPIVAAEARETIAQEDDMNALVNVGLTQRSEVLAAKSNVRAAGYGLSATRKLNVPSLTLSLSANARGNPDPFDGSAGTASLGLSWTLFDSGFQAGKLKEAHAASQSANAQLAGITQQVVSDVTQAYLALKSAEQRKAITAAQVVNATEGVRIAQGRYEAGLGTFIDVTTAQALLVSAQTSDVNADATLDQARASLARAIGQSAP